MGIPKSVVFTDGNAGLPEEGFYLHGFSETGEHVSIQILQRDIPDMPNAGRLVFNRELIDVRSCMESEILALLLAAEVSDELLDTKEGVSDYNPGWIKGKDALDGLRRSIINYVQSDKYVDIATNGIKKVLPPWQRWHRG